MKKYPTERLGGDVPLQLSEDLMKKKEECKVPAGCIVEGLLKGALIMD